MDLGLGAFLEKFEVAYGAKITRILVGLMGLTIVVLCASILLKQAVFPLYEIAQHFIGNAVPADIRDLASTVLISSLGSIGGFGIAHGLLSPYLKRADNRIKDQVNSVLEQTQAISKNCREAVEEASLYYTEAEKILEQTKTLIHEFQSPPDIESKTPL